MEVNNLRYLSKDGKVFETMEECQKYEDNLKSKNIGRNKRIGEIKKKNEHSEKLSKEVFELWDNLDDLFTQYMIDYPNTYREDLDFYIEDVGYTPLELQELEDNLDITTNYPKVDPADYEDDEDYDNEYGVFFYPF